MPNSDGRPSWDQYFMSIAKLASTRSTCLRRKVGAVIVKNKRILATGYNGAPRNMQHCLEIGCLREKLNIKSGERHELCRAIHAEQNAVIQSAVSGVSIEGADIYCTTFPCVLCSKIIINAGIQKITVMEGYPDELSQQMLDEAGIEVQYLDSANLISIDKEEMEELL
jgi:dCMP deaminase